DVYQTHIASVFKECHNIPLTFIDVPVAAESGFVEAVSGLLALPFGAFTRQDLLRVLTHPAFLCRLPEADAEEWLTWCDQLAIVHGADREAHANTYIQRDLFNWEQGGRRLLLGTFMGGARSGETRSFELGDMAYLPQEFAQDRLANAASFALIVRSLIADARFCQTERLSLSDWAAFLSHLLTAYLDAPVERDEVYVSRCLQIVQDLEALDLDGQPVSYRIAYEFVTAALENLEQRHSDYLTGGVVVSSFQPMRAIPFRVVFVVGMGEGNFPASERDDPLDVRQAQRQIGDVSPREQELYMLLETLVSTRSRLYLSYVSRDEQTGEPLQPSSAIQELMVFAGSGTISPETLAERVIHHPLRRYDPRYFPDLFPPHEGETSLTHVMPAARSEAQAVALRDDLQRFCRAHGRATPSLHDLRTELEAEQWERLQTRLGLAPVVDTPIGSSAPMGIGDTLALSLTHLRQFLYCPLQAWARWRLGLREDDADDILSCEDEPFDTPRLLATILLRETFLEKLVCDAREGGNTPFAGIYDRQAAHAELAGHLPTGIFLEAERHKHLRLLETWQANLHQAPCGAFDAPQVIRLGRAEEHAAVDVLLEPIVIEVELPHGGQSARALQVELHGRTEAVSQTLPGSLTLVASQKPQDRDILRGFFDQVVLSAATDMPPMPYHGIVNAVDTLQATSFGPISQAEATTYLQELVSDLLGAPHPYLLPVEAVLRFQHPRNNRPLSDIVQALRDNPRSHYSSRYGPVPFPEHYEAPSQAEAERMIARRFGLFFERQMT
ncbi:MAG: exodeoxyribonuclease V subunit gamma, partial [Candidatus Tectomicrobia bacterium]|nr:exodeoxyribonuclease V subunit gamma [Candidatus Tectomicrobia bacterium]